MTPKRIVAAILLLPGAAAALAAERPGYGPWQLGMSREEVLAIAAEGPYSPVPSTGGLETKNARFQGQPITASFVFGPSGLSLIQLWLYEGKDRAAAMQAFHSAYTYLGDRYGALHSDGQPIPAGLSLVDLEARIPEGFKTDPSRAQLSQLQQRGSIQAQMLKLHLHPQAPVQDAQVYASLVHSPQLGLYWVFVYTRAPSAGS